jgi:hypothetical protein
VEVLEIFMAAHIMKQNLSSGNRSFHPKYGVRFMPNDTIRSTEDGHK